MIFHSLSRFNVVPVLMVCAVFSCKSNAALDNLEDIPLEVLTEISVSTASRYTQPEWKAPAVVTVINYADIRQHGWRTLAEALASLPGFVNASDGIYTYTGTRGLFLPGDFHSRFLIQIDGFRQNDNIFQQAMIGEEFPLDMSMVDHIEYLAGPGSPVQGADAMFGVINVVTRKAEVMPKQEVSAHSSSSGRRSIALQTTHTLANNALLTTALSTAYQKPTDAQYDDPYGMLLNINGNSEESVNNTNDLRANRAFIRYNNDGFTVSGHYASRDIFPGNAVYDTVFDSPSRQKVTDTVWGVSSRYKHFLSPDLVFSSQLQTAGYRYRALNPYSNNGDLYINRYISSSVWLDGDIHLFYSGMDNHNIIAGMEIIGDIKALQDNRDVDVVINQPFNIDPREQQEGYYIQDEWSFLKNLLFNYGLRLDKDSTTDNVLSPRIGMSYRSQNGITLKLLSARAFRPANDYEREYTNGLNYIGNTNLVPETLYTQEVVLEQRTALSSSRLSLYRYEFRNLIEPVTLTNGTIQYQNTSQVITNGLEASAHQVLSEPFSIGGSLTLARTRSGMRDNVGYSPRTVVKLDMAYQLTDSWIASLDGSYISNTPLQWQGQSINIASKLLNLSFYGQQILNGLDVNVRIRNLLNARDAIPATEESPIPALPFAKRELEVGIVYAF